MQSKQNEIWFVVGSQHLYGAETLKQVIKNAEQVVTTLNLSKKLPIKLVLKSLVTTPNEIYDFCREANYHTECIGVITWLHTFSPAKMWISGLSILHKPLLQFHTQFNANVPWSTIDMDFMNLNQTAHGGREFGFIGARMGLEHSVITGHWEEDVTLERISQWMRIASAKQESQHLKIARFGDNMREVAVTEGDKVAAQIQFGYSVSAFGIGDLVEVVNDIATGDVQNLIEEYEHTYRLSECVKKDGEKRENLIDAARIELGMKKFLVEGGFNAFTTNFECLHGLKQLPGLAVQRLMQQGYGFGAEGDWKTAALLRIMKVMSHGLNGGTSFMEDYTYDFQAQNGLVVGSHMLEVCPSIASEDKPLLDVQPLGIGGKADPARLIFSTPAAPAINASLIDLGNRFRLLINEVDTIEQPEPMPNLPVARAIWQTRPNFQIGIEAWILAGGAHHTVFSQSLTAEDLRLYAQMHDIECLVIGNETKLAEFRNEMRWNAISYK